MKMRLMRGVVLLLVSSATLTAQGWRFLGPDSLGWRNVYQIDGAFSPGAPPRIGIGTSEGVALRRDSTWTYPRPNTNAPNCGPIPCPVRFSAIYFSPWNDSVCFLRTQNYEPEGYIQSIMRVDAVLSDSLWPLDHLYSGPMSGWIFGGTVAFPRYDTNRVYCLIGPVFHSSTDDGISWTADDDFTTRQDHFLTVNAASDAILYSGVNRGVDGPDTLKVAVSDDRGSSWTVIFELASAFSGARLAANDDLLLLGLGKSGEPDSMCGIFRSLDQGKEWQQVLLPVNIRGVIAGELRLGEYYAVAPEAIYRSLDRGATWQLYNNTLPSRGLTDLIRDPYTGNLYVSSDSGVYEVFQQAVDVHERPTAYLPNRFTLRQNYPNPFNPATMIDYGLPQEAFVTLKVYDILGRELFTLVNNPQSAGYHVADFDAGRLPSGVYLYRIQAGKFSDVKKMLLLR